MSSASWMARDVARIARHAWNCSTSLLHPHFWRSTESVTHAFSNLRCFFVLAAARSGTYFFASLLDSAPEASVFHEPISEDWLFLRETGLTRRQYLHHYRKRRMLQNLKEDTEVYGEVTPKLLLCGDFLSAEFPGCQLLHLVRDGRDVVRSMMSRAKYSPYRNLLPGFNPSPSCSDPWAETWDELTRFEKICWTWQDRNRRIARVVNNAVRLEELCSSYPYFRENVESYLGLQIGKKSWEQAVTRPRNVTRRHDLPHWSEWSPERVAKFQAICGETMTEMGYGDEPRWQRKCRLSGPCDRRENVEYKRKKEK